MYACLLHVVSFPHVSPHLSYPHRCNMPCTSRWFIHPNSIWWGIQIILCVCVCVCVYVCVCVGKSRCGQQSVLQRGLTAICLIMSGFVHMTGNFITVVASDTVKSCSFTPYHVVRHRHGPKPPFRQISPNCRLAFVVLADKENWIIWWTCLQTYWGISMT